jgi:hypothetical protein
MLLTSLLPTALISGCSDDSRRGQLAPGPDAPRPDAVGQDAMPDGPRSPTCTITRGSRLELQRITRIPGSALLVASPPADDRLFIVGQNGQVWIFEDGLLKTTPFLDLGPDAGGPVLVGPERGLLGLAFHPQYAQNRTFFVYYTTETANLVARYRTRAGDPSQADPASAQVLLSIDDPFANHNGGMLEFGDDGLLYIGTGDGGDANDPLNHAQDRASLLGKMLRLDVDHPADGRPYGIPAGNPFAGSDDASGGAPEIFLLGLRNPWRWSFDDATGDLYLADVGQSQREEVQVIAAGPGAGKNLGWKIYEAERCTRDDGACDPTGMTFPQLSKNHGSDGFCSIIGGDVYRGSCYPDLVGKYFYSDYCYGGVRSMSYRDGAAHDDKLERGASMPQGPSSIHAAASGELYLTTTLGIVYHLEASE